MNPDCTSRLVIMISVIVTVIDTHLEHRSEVSATALQHLITTSCFTNYHIEWRDHTTLEETLRRKIVDISNNDPSPLYLYVSSSVLGSFGLLITKPSRRVKLL